MFLPLLLLPLLIHASPFAHCPEYAITRHVVRRSNERIEYYATSDAPDAGYWARIWVDIGEDALAHFCASPCVTEIIDTEFEMHGYYSEEARALLQCEWVANTLLKQH